MKRRGERGISAATATLIDKAARIVTQYAPITVRGICYKLFIEEAIPSMGRLDTQRVSKILVYAREQKIIDSHDIVDETRPLHEVQSWGNLDAFARTIQYAYRKDYWQSQPYYVQVWSEKSTVGGVIRPVTDKYSVPFMAVHGFSSYTVLNDLAEGSGEDERQWVMLYVGDFDPSGMYMSEHDIPQRTAKYNGNVTIRRIALREDDLPGLPDFPAKPSDTRYKWYRDHYGTIAWELDAMDQNALRARVDAAIRAYIDEESWARMELVEAAERQTVEAVADQLARRTLPKKAA